MSKQEATRLADALGRAFTVYGVFEPSPREKVALEAADLLRRWPDGEPVGKVLTEAEMGIGWDGRAGNILWWRKPDAPALLYTAQPVKPDGEPVAWLYEARYIDTAWTVCVGLNNPGPEGAYLRGVRPLYTAQPAEADFAPPEFVDTLRAAVEKAPRLPEQPTDDDPPCLTDSHTDVERIAALEAELARATGEGRSLAAALDVARNGILWYHDTYPDSVNDSDHDALRQIDAALQGHVATESDRIAALEAENARLLATLSTPELHDFAKAVALEGAHQRLRWGAAHDEGKSPEDWFWTLGYLGGKALAAVKAGDIDKALHHTITAAALLANWHAAIDAARSKT